MSKNVRGRLKNSSEPFIYSFSFFFVNLLFPINYCICMLFLLFAFLLSVSFLTLALFVSLSLSKQISRLATDKDHSVFFVLFPTAFRFRLRFHSLRLISVRENYLMLERGGSLGGESLPENSQTLNRHFFGLFCIGLGCLL